MRTNKVVALATASLIGAALLPLTAGNVSAAPSRPGDAKAPGVAAPAREGSDRISDDLTMPWQKEYEERTRLGLEQRLRSGSDAGVQKLARGKYAKTAETGGDRIFVVIAEFGDTRHSAYCDDVDTDDNPANDPCAYPSDGTPKTYEGPEHNAIPKPNRKLDNTTLWQKDYDRQHYQDMYFNRMRTFYENQSLGRYTFDGDVTEWVKVPFNEARYGRDFCGDIVCNNTWFLVRDALAYWVDGQKAAGWSDQRIQDYLETFDKQDRYDFDEDGDFNEPDGYIDHFQVVHAGGDQADGERSRPPTRSGATAGTPSSTRSAPAPRTVASSAASRSARAAPRTAPAPTCRSRTTRPVSGSVTTPSSRRTAA